ncbi:Pr6Pr family membrane protein, partial [Clavibacter michiganensis]|uniref:Pr6Pr family membrane protein n=1 Tax=Clavibacter michiganensis TaxID=28447 RepID=UPI0037575CDF
GVSGPTTRPGTPGGGGGEIVGTSSVRILFSVVRIATAIAAVIGVIAQYHVNYAYWQDLGVTGIAGKSLDFALFFTVDANLLGAVVLIVGGVRLARGRVADPGAGWVTLRLASTVYLVITGIVWNALLRGQPQPEPLKLDWADQIVHVAVPLIVLLDWILAPDRRPLRAGAIGRVIAFPLAWILVTLARGPFTGDEVFRTATYYPYGFLNPDSSPGGYGMVAAYVVGLTLAGCAITGALILVSRFRAPTDPHRRATPAIR